MSQEFNPSNVVFKEIVEIDEFDRWFVFECSGYNYSARTYQNILQYVKGPKPPLKINNEIPTELEEIEHEERKEIYNNNHTPIQNWIDSLI